MLLPSEGQSLSANQISSRYLNWRLRYNYFPFRNTNVRHIGILLPVSISTIFSNRRVIPHQAAEFGPNRSTHCGNMTSYPFVKLAAAAAQYYFRFCICWSHCLRKVNIYQPTKLRRHISIHGWDITTSGCDKQTSTILEFYFHFRSGPFHRNGRVILHRSAEFRQNRNIHCGNITSYRFSRWRPSAMLYLL